MTAVANVAALAQGGGLPATQVQQAVQQALQPLQLSQAQTAAALTALQQAVLRAESTAAKAYNSGVRNGGVRNFVPVPNGLGVLAPVGPAGMLLAPLRSFADLQALGSAELSAWCTHYGILVVPQVLAQRRLGIALALGAVPLAGELA